MKVVITYEAIAEDMTHASDTMGSAYTTEESLGLFKKPKDAILACEKHFGGIIKTWIHQGKDSRSNDLGWVMYHIRHREIK